MLKHIVISPENYLGLKELGRAGDSFNDVITKLLMQSKSNLTKRAGEDKDER